MSDRPIAGDEPLARLKPAAYTLGDLLPAYALLNHGCLFTHGGLDEASDPVVDHCTHRGVPPGEVLLLEEQWAPFAGIDRPGGPSRWDRRLVAVPRPLWAALLADLTGIVIRDEARGVTLRAHPLLVYIQEPGVASRRLDPATTPWVQVTLLGLVDAAGQTHAANPTPAGGPDGRIVVRRLPVDASWAQPAIVN